MICETMIDAEREESHEAHYLKLLNVLMKCIEEAIEEGNLFDDNEDDNDDYYDEDDDDESDDDNDNCVCLCHPTDTEAGYCCCSARDKKCNGKCCPDGYDNVWRVVLIVEKTEGLFWLKVVTKGSIFSDLSSFLGCLRSV